MFWAKNTRKLPVEVQFFIMFLIFLFDFKCSVDIKSDPVGSSQWIKQTNKQTKDKNPWSIMNRAVREVNISLNK